MQLNLHRLTDQAEEGAIMTREAHTQLTQLEGLTAEQAYEYAKQAQRGAKQASDRKEAANKILEKYSTKLNDVTLRGGTRRRMVSQPRSRSRKLKMFHKHYTKRNRHIGSKKYSRRK